MSTAEVLLAITAVVFAIVAQHYKHQRDDLAALLVFLHPDDFPEAHRETSDESTGSSGDSRS